MAPTRVATIPADGAGVGEAITPDGKLLLAAAGSGAYVMSLPAAESGGGHAVLGSLTSPGGQNAGEIAFSPDSRFAFITMQGSADIAVFDLTAAVAHGFGRAGFVGMVPLGPEPTGIARSPDGHYLYVVAQNGHAHHVEGKLYVVDLRRAETDPAHAVVQSVTAGCEPSRVLVSADGNVVWVTDRASNALVGFSAAKLATEPWASMIVRVSVGQTPIGLSIVNGGKDIMVADANLYDVSGGYTLALVSTQRAMQRSPHALLGFLAVGQVPREIASEPDGTALVTYNETGQLQVFGAGSLP
jgi:DNA-binding beta-propeller fold protein YncE